MKHLLLAAAFLLATSALADSPEAILKDYRTRAAQAVERLNQSLEKAATPLITKLVAGGDTDGAELLTNQLKDKAAGEPVPTPQASAVQLFSLYDEARSKALAPIQKASIARIDSLLKTAGGPKIEILTELGKVRAEIESGNSSSAADSGAEVAKTGASAGKKIDELVKSLGGVYTAGVDGGDIKFTGVSISASDLQQIGTVKTYKSFTWNGGSGLTDEGMTAFEGMKKLEFLHLWSTGRITDAGLKHLVGCDKLNFLNIGGNGDGVTGSGLESLANCRSLRELTLNLFTKLDGQYFRYLTKLKSLKILRLASCTGIKDADMDLIGQMTSLQNLRLEKTSVTDAGLAKLAGLRNLENLSVSEPLVTQAGVQAFKKLRPKVVVEFVK